MDEEYEWVRKRGSLRKRWCPCYSPTHVANLRSVILVYSAFVTLQVIHWYATANLPRVRGGRWENPLNDARSFCCVYRHDPCVGGHRAACTIHGRLVIPGDLNVSSYSMLFYGAHGVVFVVASLSLWGPWIWWLFDIRRGTWRLREQYTTAVAFVLQAWLLYMRYRVGFPVIQVF